MFANQTVEMIKTACPMNVAFAEHVAPFATAMLHVIKVKYARIAFAKLDAEMIWFVPANNLASIKNAQILAPITVNVANAPNVPSSITAFSAAVHQDSSETHSLDAPCNQNDATPTANATRAVYSVPKNALRVTNVLAVKSASKANVVPSAAMAHVHRDNCARTAPVWLVAIATVTAPMSAPASMDNAWIRVLVTMLAAKMPSAKWPIIVSSACVQMVSKVNPRKNVLRTNAMLMMTVTLRRNVLRDLVAIHAWRVAIVASMLSVVWLIRRPNAHVHRDSLEIQRWSVNSRNREHVPKIHVARMHVVAICQSVLSAVARLAVSVIR